MSASTEETLVAAVDPVGYSWSHFATSTPMGARQFRTGLPSRCIFLSWGYLAIMFDRIQIFQWVLCYCILHYITHQMTDNMTLLFKTTNIFTVWASGSVPYTNPSASPGVTQHVGPVDWASSIHTGTVPEETLCSSKSYIPDF